MTASDGSDRRDPVDLSGRRIVLGVSGGVAAYKAAYLARRLVESGADVRTVMTEGARRFLGAPTLAAVTGHPVVTDLFDDPTSVSPHTDLARWADLVVVAPATAHVLARVAHGLSGDALTALLLAFDGPAVLAPAMHTEMWEHPATRRNVETLVADGYTLVGPASGPLAGGDVGEGRMSEPEEIVAAVATALRRPLEGRRILVSAGGTREPIDPVRYVGNRSSGKMGHAIAAEAARAGADVVLVTTVEPPAELARAPRVEVVPVTTAEEMAEAVWSRADDVDAVVMAAAVADFRPKAVADTKIKRVEGPPVVELEPTPDILAGLAARPHRPLLVGFAAETGDLSDAVDKARRKGVDLLVANDVTAPGSGFGTDTNQVTVITPDGTTEPWPLLTKREVGRRLVERIAALLDERGTSTAG